MKDKENAMKFIKELKRKTRKEKSGLVHLHMAV
jgi:predicted GIY-YIG superfamily endonuclease